MAPISYLSEPGHRQFRAPSSPNVLPDAGPDGLSARAPVFGLRPEVGPDDQVHDRRPGRQRHQPIVKRKQREGYRRRFSGAAASPRRAPERTPSTDPRRPEDRRARRRLRATGTIRRRREPKRARACSRRRPARAERSGPRRKPGSSQPHARAAPRSRTSRIGLREWTMQVCIQPFCQRTRCANQFLNSCGASSVVSESSDPTL